MNKRNQQVGFTLIEILVAIVISAIGLLGIARLQLVTLQNNSGSQYRSIAIQLSSDLLERMRANAQGVNAANYNQPASTVQAAAYTAPVATCTNGGLCSPAERAATDLAEAMAQARLALPGGAIIACIDSGSGSDPSFDGNTINHQCDGIGAVHAIKVFWLDDRSNQNSVLAQGGYTVFVTRGTP